MLGPECKRPTRRLVRGYLASGLLVPAVRTVIVWPRRPSKVASGPVTSAAARDCALAMLCVCPALVILNDGRDVLLPRVWWARRPRLRRFGWVVCPVVLLALFSQHETS